MEVLKKYATPGDFIFLDPPYIPVSEYADFKRYTKEQFYVDDHKALAEEVKRLQKLGCYVILTNSNHPLVHELYKDFQIDVIATKRAISSKGDSRKGEDVIVTAFPDKSFLEIKNEPLPEQVNHYPPTRFMGSKSKLIGDIWSVAANFDFDSVLDLFSGSGIVGYMFKAQGKRIISKHNQWKYYLTPEGYFYSNRLSLFLEKAKVIDDIKERIETYFDEFLIDEIQDIAGRDINFLETLMSTNVDMLFVGDFFQHTFDTSRDGNVNKNLNSRKS